MTASTGVERHLSEIGARRHSEPYSVLAGCGDASGPANADAGRPLPSVQSRRPRPEAATAEDMYEKYVRRDPNRGRFSHHWWVGKSVRGYPTIEVGRDRLDVQSLVYALYVGRVPSGSVITSTCSLGACLRPQHLLLTPRRRPLMQDRRGTLNPMATLTTETVIQMRRVRAGGATYRQIARRFNTSPGNASDICNRRTWSHVK